MAGLVPAISIGMALPCPTKRDARDKRGHDGSDNVPLANFLALMVFRRLLFQAVKRFHRLAG
jgi:hypothetical protein